MTVLYSGKWALTLHPIPSYFFLPCDSWHLLNSRLSHPLKKFRVTTKPYKQPTLRQQANYPQRKRSRQTSCLATIRFSPFSRQWQYNGNNERTKNKEIFTRTWVWGLVLRVCVGSVRVWNAQCAVCVCEPYKLKQPQLWGSALIVLRSLQPQIIFFVMTECR